MPAAHPKKPRRLGDRINQALAQLLLLGNPGGVDTTLGGYGTTISTGSGGHGTHKPRGNAPTDFRPIALEWADFFRRAVDMAELDLERERGGSDLPPPSQVRPGKVTKGVTRARKARIRRSPIYSGRRPEFVAYVEGCSVSLVRETRLNAGLDPLTGFPVDEPRPVTSRRLPDA